VFRVILKITRNKKMKSELKNFIDHYGWDELLDMIEEISKERDEPVKIILQLHKNEKI